MFDIGGSELLLICIVTCLVVDPKKVPAIVRDMRSYYKRFTKIKRSVFRMIRDSCKECSIDDDEEKDKIVGDDGVLYRVHDVKDLEKLKQDKRRNDSQSTDS